MTAPRPLSGATALPVSHTFRLQTPALSAQLSMETEPLLGLLFEVGRIAPTKAHRYANRIKRQVDLKLALDRPIWGGTISVTAAGLVSLVDTLGVGVGIDRAILSIGYMRVSGKPKVMFRHFFQSGWVTVNIGQLLSSYSAVYAVDTNKRLIKGRECYVTGVVRARTISIMGSDTAIEIDWQNTSHSWDPHPDPEARGWAAAIQYIAHELRTPDTNPIALVVDCHLGKLEGINGGTLPYFENAMLPANTVLVYASDAAGTEEFLPCKLIRMADAAAAARASALAREVR